MNSDEIRGTNYGEVSYLREIAAQLAELNQNIKLLRPQEEPKDEVEITPEAAYAYEQEDESLKEQRIEFEELLKSPTSDPKKFVRCDTCGKEVDRPEWCDIGENIICDQCIPF